MLFLRGWRNTIYSRCRPHPLFTFTSASLIMTSLHSYEHFFVRLLFSHISSLSSLVLRVCMWKKSYIIYWVYYIIIPCVSGSLGNTALHILIVISSFSAFLWEKNHIFSFLFKITCRTSFPNCSVSIRSNRIDMFYRFKLSTNALFVPPPLSMSVSEDILEKVFHRERKRRTKVKGNVDC